MEKYIHVIFSSTPYKMSKFIRVFTRNFYNHTSISIDPNLEEFYSFARKYKRAPFYGGFVHESKLRFVNNNVYSVIKIAKIPVTDEQYDEISQILNNMKKERDKYIYNTMSAFVSFFGKKLIITNAFTCVEFVIHLLRTAGILNNIDPYKNYSIRMLEMLLNEYIVFEGEIEISKADWADDKFNEDKSTLAFFKLQVKSNLRLLGRLTKDSLKNKKLRSL